MSASVRRAEERDFQAVTALLEELGRAGVTPETREACRLVFERQLASPGAAHLVAENGAGAVGFCSLHFRERLNYPTPDAWIPDLVVTAEARRRGVARLLLGEAERLARARRCRRLMLESGHRRTEAHALYRDYGMSDTGTYFVLELE